MRKFFLILAGIAMMAGGALVSAPAMAHSNTYQTQRSHNYHPRPHYQKRHHRRVCRTVIRKKVVWRHHRRHVVHYRTRVCNWRR